jgi:xylan 1,4-beta-xylosidase
MLGIMQGKRILVNTENGINANHIIENGVRIQNDVNALASKEGNSVWILVWNYHDLNQLGTSNSVNLKIDGLKNGKALLHHYRVDENHSNSFEKWKAIGCPQNVTQEQFKELEKSGQLALLSSPEWKNIKNNTTNINFELPQQGVSLIQLTW